MDAFVRIGELTKALPKATSGTGGNRYQPAPPRENDTAVGFSNPKSEVIADLGFTPKQVERFEALAKHKDIVEQVKAEARETGSIPTRQKVLDIAQLHREVAKQGEAIIDRDFDNLKKLRNAVSLPAWLYFAAWTCLVARSFAHAAPVFAAPERLFIRSPLFCALTLAGLSG